MAVAPPLSERNFKSIDFIARSFLFYPIPPFWTGGTMQGVACVKQQRKLLGMCTMKKPRLRGAGRVDLMRNLNAAQATAVPLTAPAGVTEKSPALFARRGRRLGTYRLGAGGARGLAQPPSTIRARARIGSRRQRENEPKP